MRIAHLSDPHFGTETPALHEALQAWLLAERPDAIVLSGDVTQRARPREFAAARRFFDALAPLTVLAVPGNHDIPLWHLGLRALAPYRRWHACFDAPLEPVLDAPGALVVGVNTTRRWLHTDGRVGAAQVRRVAGLLAAAAPAQLRIAVVHQPIAVLRPQDVHDRLRGHARALAAWGAAGCDLVLGGHIHLPYVRALPLAATGGRPLYVVQAGTALSTRVRAGAPNSVNLIHTQPPAADGTRRCTVERWDHDPRNGFAAVETHRLDLAPAG